MISCLLLNVFLVACWDKHELQHLGIILGFGIDIVPEQERQNGEKILLTSELANVLQGTGLEESQTFSSTGKSVLDALRNTKNKMERDIFVGITRELVLGKSVVEEGANKYIDYFYRDNDLSPNIYIVIAEESAKDLMKGKAGLTHFSSIGRMDILDMQELRSSGRIHAITLSEYIQCMMKENKAILVPVAALEAMEDKESGSGGGGGGGGQNQSRGNKGGGGSSGGGSSGSGGSESHGQTKVYFKCMAILDDNGRFVANLEDMENYGAMFWLNKSRNLVLPIENKSSSEIISVYIQKFSRKMKWEINNDKLKLNVNLKALGYFGEEEGTPGPFTSGTNNKKLKAVCAQEIEKIMTKTWNRSLSLQQDFLNIGEHLKKHEYKTWQKVKKDWPQAMKDIEININVEPKISFNNNANKSMWKER
ncbi:MAG: Ger(x)C family spore germination protein [Bacillota bacterium]